MNSQGASSEGNNHSEKLRYLFDLEFACQREAERRFRMIGNELAKSEYNDQELRDRARAIDIPPGVLAAWLRACKEQGLSGLLPEWDELDKKKQRKALERYEQLGEFADAETIDKEQIAELAERHGWTFKRAKRWLRRYRVGGLWGLAPGNNPQKRPRTKAARRSLILLSEYQLQKMYNHRAALGDLADKLTVSEDEVKERAKVTGKHPNTIWTYLRRYREDGLIGLAPRRRSDRGGHRDISERMVKIVEGIYLSNPKKSIRAVREDAARIARELGEPEPTTWQVRSICENISELVKVLADGDEDNFRNLYRFTHRMRFDGVIYQIDHTKIDVLLRDIRKKRERTKSETIRPWLTLVMDAQSRLVMAAQFGYDRPDRFTVAAAIRDAILISERKPYGGIPEEIWVDRGKELVSHHIRQLLDGLNITFPEHPPHQPQLRGRVERFFGTLNTRLWCTLPGYVGSNTTERPPNVKAKLTLSELVGKFWTFIKKYHAEEHSGTGESRLEYWEQNCFAMPANPRFLDILLKEQDQRQVRKSGIYYKNRIYWHPDLGPLVGERIVLRAGPSYHAPDEIEVFHDEAWICTAIATDSILGETVSQEEIAAAQSQQRQVAREKINQAIAAKEAAEREIEAGGVEDSDSSQELPDQVEEKPKKTLPPEPKPRKPDLLDLVDGQDGSEETP